MFGWFRHHHEFEKRPTGFYPYVTVYSFVCRCGAIERHVTEPRDVTYWWDHIAKA